MTASDAWLLVLAAFLLLIATVLAIAETALAHVSRARVDELLREGRRGAGRHAYRDRDGNRNAHRLAHLG